MVVDNTEIFFRVCRKTTIDKEQDIAGIYFGKKYKDTLNPVFFDIFKKYRRNLESRYECIIGKDDFICFATQNKKKFIKEFGSSIQKAKRDKKGKNEPNFNPKRAGRARLDGR